MDPYANNPGEPQKEWQPSQPAQPQPPQAQPQSPYGAAFNNWQQPVAQSPQQPQAPAQPPQPSPYQPPHPYAPSPYSSPAQPPRPAPEPQPLKGKGKHLNLSRGEVVLSDVRRHPIGVLQIYFVAAFVLLALLFGGGALVMYLNSTSHEGIVGGTAFPFPTTLITGLAFGLGLLTVVIAAIAIHVYRGNRLFVTNESIIQFIQTSLFSTKQQTISLGNIEDVSYEQSGVMPHIFNYGTIRLSTEGEETTYYFRYAAHPKDQAAKINDAQEAFIRTHPGEHT